MIHFTRDAIANAIAIILHKPQEINLESFKSKKKNVVSRHFRSLFQPLTIFAKMLNPRCLTGF